MISLIVNGNPYFGRGFLVSEKIFLKIIHKIFVILKRITNFVLTIKTIKHGSKNSIKTSSIKN